jgi:hypothetical protein
MQLKIVAWNMGHWSHRARATAAWTFLGGLGADCALVQEAVPPSDLAIENCVWREIGGTRRWGSGIVSWHLPLEAFELKANQYPGALTLAKTVLSDGSALLLISMYRQMDEHGYSITTLHRMLSDLTHLLHGKLPNTRRLNVVLGGDLNASLQMDAKQGDNSHWLFFQRLEDFGFVDCQGTFGSSRPRTLRHHTSNFPWVNDYIFATEWLASKVVAAEVSETPQASELSDHNPVIVTFAL